ncbi:MAG TPA: amino acid adenylation domain-containing protein [Thermoanaerobaculia bacterium]|nr:amino acid adenylation domain-containing protein [Thermoanaerobaculia bacterium]
MAREGLQGFRLSPIQRRLLAQSQGAPEVFTARLTLEVEGSLERPALLAAVATLVGRHAALRTRFPRASVLAVPVQVVGEEEEVRLLEGEADGRADGPEAAPLTVRWIRRAPDRHLLVLTLPALCADEASLALLARELVAAYRGAAGELAPAPLQYPELGEWLHELEAGEDEECLRGRTFWRWRATEAPASLTLPGQHPAAPEAAFAPAWVQCELEPPEAAGLEAWPEARGRGPESALLAAWVAFLARAGGLAEVPVGVLADGRRYEEVASAVGLVAQHLPLRFEVGKGLTFAALAERVAAAVEEAAGWQELLPWDQGLEARKQVPSRPWLFAFADWREGQVGGACSFRIRELRSVHEAFWARFEVTRRGASWQLALGYDTRVLTAEVAARLLGQVRTLLGRGLASPDLPLARLELLDEATRHHLLDEVGVAAPPRSPAGPLLAERVAEHARIRPEATALCCEGRRMSYRQLDEEANRLAHWLRRQGVGREDRVAIFLESSAEAVVALLAVSRSGGAYVPLDPAFPAARLAAMLEDAAPRCWITRSDLLATLPAPPCPVLCLDRDGELLASQPAEPVAAGGIDPANLCYVLFTSGSTGRPKGVAVEHRQVLGYLGAILDRLELAPGASYATVSTFAADLGLTSVLPALATGGCLHVISPRRAADPTWMASYLERHPIDLLKIVPSHLEALWVGLGAALTWPRKVLVIGGEAASPALVETLRERLPALAVLNHYGPTETTVGALSYRLRPAAAEPEAYPLPLGRPLPGYRVALLDAAGVPVPLDWPGEVYLGGAGVTRGYFGRPGATAERFLPDARGAEPGARCYRTGDLARFRGDGQLVFLGRVDHQVKLHGYRIEIGEVEAALKRHPDVRDAVAVVCGEPPRDLRLVAFVVPRPGRTFALPALRAHLATLLPEPMIPASLQLVESLPLTPNGKVDRVALAARGPARGGSQAEKVAPRNPAETTLAEIWQQVLGLEAVGVHDNFFELGGDSIQVIQIVAKAGRAGLRFEPHQFFEHQTIAELAEVAATAPGPSPAADQPVTGSAPLTPIERWFFEQDFADPHHWNQAVLWQALAPIRPAALRSVLEAVLAHHDALRLRFERGEEGWRQVVEGPSIAPPFHQISLEALSTEDRRSALERLTAQAQASLRLERAPLMRALLFDPAADGRPRLLLVLHHLLVDGVSWRILLEDLITALEAVAKGEPIALPAKTGSFLEWARRLDETARAGAFDDELDHWLSQAPRTVPPLPLDHPGGLNTYGSERSLTESLSIEDTEKLLRGAGLGPEGALGELLFAAVVATVASWSGARQVLVDREGHGREPFAPGLDVSRTVGWFTTHFPVCIDLEGAADDAERRARIAAAWRRLPRNGFGFGALRYLRGEPSIEGPLAAGARPELSFNYLGQFDQADTQSALFALAEEPPGPARSARARRPHLLSSISRVRGGRLELEWRYSEALHRRETVAALLAGVAERLREWASQGQASEAVAVAGPDPAFGLAGLDADQLAQVIGRVKQAGAQGP